MLKPAASPRGRHDPAHRWQTYAEVSSSTEAASGPWDSRIVVLEMVSGRRMGVHSTWQLTEVFHKTLISRWDKHLAEFGPMPSWLSGQVDRAAADSPASPAGHTHLAMFPLPFVGSPHATGHLLGIGLALPRPEAIGLTAAALRKHWRMALRCLLGDDAEPNLHLHALDGSWDMDLRIPTSHKQALDASRWTKAARVWQSITPIVLDRHPKPHFQKNPIAWAASCREIIARSCVRSGWPEPDAIEPSFYSSCEGVPPSMRFPAPKAKPGMPPRVHLHATLQFPQPVAGPLLLGAGRYRGYGLMMPLA